MFTNKAKTLVVWGALFLMASPILAERTPLRTGPNVFSVQQDTEIGRAVAQQASNTLTFSNDSYAHGYINALGGQISVHAPGYKYPYEFQIYMDPSISSIALPGGLIYVSSGMILSAQTEPELAMILAHQIGHVVGRHGTQQVSQSYNNRYRGNQFANQPANQSRPSVDNVMATLNLTLDPDSVILRYTAQDEQQADVIATQMLFDARFNPNQLVPAFQRMSNLNRLRDAFFSNHPAPGNRAALIRRELQNLGPLPGNMRGDSPDLHTTQRHLRDEANGATRGRITESRTSQNNISQPSSRMISYQGRDYDFRHPENWVVTVDGDTVRVAPEGGIVGGSLASGMTISTFVPQQNRGFFGNSFSLPGQRSTGTTPLSAATDQLLSDLRFSNPNMRVVRSEQRRIAGSPALLTELSNDSPVGGREVDRLFTVLRPNGELYYFLGVSPQADANRYAAVFDQIINSVRFY